MSEVNTLPVKGLAVTWIDPGTDTWNDEFIEKEIRRFGSTGLIINDVRSVSGSLFVKLMKDGRVLLQQEGKQEHTVEVNWNFLRPL